MTAVMVRNQLVKEESRTGQALRLVAPLKPTLLRRMVNAGTSKRSFEFDDLGLWCWDRIDGRRTVESLIEEFAATHRLNIREAEVSVLAFLKMLTQRNLAGLVAKRAAQAKTPQARNKSRHKR